MEWIIEVLLAQVEQKPFTVCLTQNIPEKNKIEFIVRNEKSNEKVWKYKDVKLSKQNEWRKHYRRWLLKSFCDQICIWTKKQKITLKTSLLIEHWKIELLW